MAQFSYRAIDPSGALVSGTQRAPNIQAANTALLERDLQPVQVNEKTSLLKFELTKKKAPRTDVMHFSRQLAVFVKAGIPILEAIEIIAEEASNKVFGKVLSQMIESLAAGETLADTAALHPEAFPRYYVGILKAAELTGEIDLVLNQLADYMQRDTDARSKITSALVYPAVVAVMAVVTVLVLAVFVLPRFEVFFASLHAKLPLPTRLLLSCTGVLTKRWAEIIGGLAVIGVLGVVTFRTERGRRRIDGTMLKLPIIGDLIRHSILERICRILSSMIRAGVSLPEAMVVTANATNNAVYRIGLAHIRAGMLNGAGLAGPLAETGLFPGAARQIFRVGEETGTLDIQLQTAADFYDRELDFKIKRFTSLFEPAVIVIMGAVVGFVAVALVSAMYGIYRQVKV